MRISENHSERKRRRVSSETTRQAAPISSAIFRASADGAELLARVAQRAVIRPYATVIPCARDTLSLPMIQAHTTSGSLYGSAFVADWAGETPLFTDTDPKFARFNIAVKKIRAGTRLSNDFVSDSGVDVLAWLARNGGDNIAVVEDAGFIAGDGATLQPGLAARPRSSLWASDAGRSGARLPRDERGYPRLIGRLLDRFGKRNEQLGHLHHTGTIESTVGDDGVRVVKLTCECGTLLGPWREV
jgi:hypothetical protein